MSDKFIPSWVLAVFSFSFSIPAMSQEAGKTPDFSIAAEGQAGAMWTHDVRYLIDRTNNTFVTTGGDVGTYGAALTLAYRPARETWLPSVVFGERPTFRVSGGYWSSDKSSRVLKHNPPANALVNIDGTDENTNFQDGSYHTQLRMEGVDVDLVVEGDAAAGWSLSPLLGLTFHSSDQNYSINTRYENGSNRPIIRGDLSNQAGGFLLGVSLRSPDVSGWRLAVSPSARLMMARSKMHLKQDPYEVTGSLDTLSVLDKDKHFMANPALAITATGNLGLFSLSAGVKGDYFYGSPYFDLSSRSGDSSRIGLSNENFGVSGNLSAKLNF